MRLHSLGRDIERPRDLLIRLIESHERQQATLALASGFARCFLISGEQTPHARQGGSGWSPTKMRGSIIRTCSPRSKTPSVEGVSYSQSSRRGRSLTARRRESKGASRYPRRPRRVGWAGSVARPDLAWRYARMLRPAKPTACLARADATPGVVCRLNQSITGHAPPSHISIAGGYTRATIAHWAEHSARCYDLRK